LFTIAFKLAKAWIIVEEGSFLGNLFDALSLSAKSNLWFGSQFSVCVPAGTVSSAEAFEVGGPC